MIRDARERKDQVDALVTRYVVGEISETVLIVSLHRHIDVDEIRHLVALNQIAHRNSLPYRRGELS